MYKYMCLSCCWCQSHQQQWFTVFQSGKQFFRLLVLWLKVIAFVWCRQTICRQKICRQTICQVDDGSSSSDHYQRLVWRGHNPSANIYSGCLAVISSPIRRAKNVVRTYLCPNANRLSPKLILSWQTLACWTLSKIIFNWETHFIVQTIRVLYNDHYPW
jgi:hypothetical protein